MKLKQTEIDFITNNLNNGAKLIQDKDWTGITDALDELELDIGYSDGDFNDVNDTGIYIERLIDKIADDDENDNVLEIEDE